MAHRIQTPRGEIITAQAGNGRVRAQLTWNEGFGEQWSGNFSRSQKFVDSECLRYMNPLTPFDTGMLIRSGTLGTIIGSGEIKYVAPYARKQYYENKGKGKRGKLWFDRMKTAHKEAILRGAQRIAGGGS